MMRLVRSSIPGHVELDNAIHLLSERAVLTRSVCRELLECEGNFADRRPRLALSHLLSWVQHHFPEHVHVEPHPSDGLKHMIVPDSYQLLYAEVLDGAYVSEALFMLMIADNSIQSSNDKKGIRERLDAYWSRHSKPVRVGFLIS
ncbi:MAG: hypothetical protein QM703_13875 [Gemmatales bacterium]